MIDYVGRCKSAWAPWLREAVGSYVLGALCSAESDLVSVHLAECSSCHGEYLEFRALLPLLAALTEADAWRLDSVCSEPPALNGISVHQRASRSGSRLLLRGDRLKRIGRTRRNVVARATVRATATTTVTWHAPTPRTRRLRGRTVICCGRCEHSRRPPWVRHSDADDQ